MALEQKLSLLPPLPPPVVFPDSGLGATLFPGILDVSPLDLPHPCSRPSFPSPDILEAGRPSCLLALLLFPYLLLLLLPVPSLAKLPSPLPFSRPPLCFSSSSPRSKRFHLLVAFAELLPSLLPPPPPSSPQPPPCCLSPACCPRTAPCPPCSSAQPWSAAAGRSPRAVVGPGRRPG